MARDNVLRWRAPIPEPRIEPTPPPADTAVQLQSEKKAEEEEKAEDVEEEAEKARLLDRATQTAFNKHLVVAGSCNYIFYVEKKVTNRVERRNSICNVTTYFYSA